MDSNVSQKLFLSRRLAHANMFVSDYVKASDFYRNVFGFAEAYRQPDNLASFLSNGNTYHDFALVDIRSKYAKAGQRPGLNHLAFEVDSEADLVNAYKAALTAGIQFIGPADHDVARSIYLKDPDGNEIEFYADVVEDWEATRRGIIVKQKPRWIPGETNVPDTRHLYNPNPNLKQLPDTLVRGKRVTHMALVTRDFSSMYRFYTEVAGLRPFFSSQDGTSVLLAGTASTGDIALTRDERFTPGMHHVGVEVWSEDDLRAAAKGVGDFGGKIVREVDHASRHAVCVQDTDGLVMQLYVNRDWTPKTIATASSEDLPFLL
ncbi:VOC family protein [Pandoraea terrigena]|uniref:Glyoxalase n=1 Tax=Pandoraea terrigena TaxID=2508292 RepID=A0A5E4VEU6_9BURK|nr:VOC family protein [Pandoraea terrigena]VVE10114.1 glyoxalase [Pandoraea terrigena]